jgi:cobalt-zinc-cadmium efflux system outer membrane protein
MSLGIGALLLAGSAQAQKPSEAARKPSAEQFLDRENGLSLNDAISGALEREPSLRAARTAIEAAQGMRVQAGLRPNPMMSLERREQPDGEDNQTTLGVEWPLDLFRRGARVTVADREAEAVNQSVADRVRMLVADVRLKYGEAAASIRALAIADNLAGSAERDLLLRRARVDEGASPPFERDVLEVELRRLESHRLLALGSVESAIVELKRVIGIRPETTIRLRDTIDALVARTPLAPSNSLTVQRADVREAEVRVRLADARIERARSEGRFDISLFGSYMRMASAFPQRGFNREGTLEPVQGVFHYLTGGTTITLPLRNRNQGEIAVARAERTAAEARLEEAQLAADAEVVSAAAQDARARQALEIIEAAVGLSGKNLEVIRQTYELGRATVAEVLAEQRRYLELETTYTGVLRTTYAARVMLLRARGELP